MDIERGKRGLRCAFGVQFAGACASDRPADGWVAAIRRLCSPLGLECRIMADRLEAQG